MEESWRRGVSDMEDRFALLIDADNVSAKYIKPILDELSKYGNVTYKRIYGDWTKSNSASWKEELLQNSITPIQQFSYTQGKNSTDSAMIIDAMDMLYTSELEGFCLVSSDSDFTKLASRLRESGKMVIGMGEDKTPLPFRKACDIFTVLEVLLEDNTIEKEESEGKSYHPHVFGRGQKKISGASLSSLNGKGSKEKIEKVSKEKIEEIISTYNDKVKADGNENLKIEYTDIVGLMMTSVSTIIDAISVILIAFVAISLVVSSIMIGIITYISVLERTKEIGILRAMGASKRDISRVFNAETLIVGFAAGAIGIGVTLLLLIPANAIVYNLTGISGMCVLPWQGAVILVIISMLLTLIAGLIPSHYAAKKDPVLALRSE